MAKYNVTRIAPDGFLHHQAFAEIQDSLAWSLAALGNEVNTSFNWLSEHGETNIVLGCELAADFQRLPAGSIILNLEQPSHPNMAKVRKIARDSNATVWDYSSRSVEEWKAAGHDRVCHLPIGYSGNLTRIQHLPPEWDVMFVGWMTPRRTAVIDALRAAGLKVFASAACYGGGRDNIIARSKVCLVVHHDGRDRHEIIRSSYLMANGKCVVAEVSTDDDEYEDLRNGLIRVPYRLFEATCLAYCRDNDSERLLVQEKAMALIRKRDFTQAVAAALDATTAAAMPVLSRPMEFATTRASAKREFIAEARELKRSRDPRVAIRYKLACLGGDMKDFAPWLREHARGNVVEIGVRDGGSTSAFLAGVEEHGGFVYSIDVQPCEKLFEGHPQWKFIRANSTDFAAVLPHIPFEIDVLLLDGDHARAGVLNDFEYARQVRAGGLVLFHDTEPEIRPSGCGDSSWPGDDVKRVYAELCAALAPQGWTHYTIPGRYGLGVLQKPPMTPPAPIAVEPETTEVK